MFLCPITHVPFFIVLGTLSIAHFDNTFVFESLLKDGVKFNFFLIEDFLIEGPDP